MHWRWQEDNTPGTPWANMAVDGRLLAELGRDAAALPIVRVYRWDRPAVSLGRLQDQQAVSEMFPGLPQVRRPTGGRAVMHGQDVTVSVVVREGDLPPSADKGVMSSYRQIVGAVVEAFCRIGVPASLGGEGRSPDETASADCFAFAARCDVVAQANGRKLAGCAQRRQDGAILQQMSIPLSRISDERMFLLALRDGFARNCGVTRWLSVDTPPRL